MSDLSSLLRLWQSARLLARYDALLPGEYRARLPLSSPRRIVFLGCTSGAGQSVTAYMTAMGGQKPGTTIDESYAHCWEVTSSQAKNFAYGIRLLEAHALGLLGLRGIAVLAFLVLPPFLVIVVAVGSSRFCLLYVGICDIATRS